MKKILFVLMAIFALSLSTNAATIKVVFANGQTLEGVFIFYNDTSLLMQPKDQTKQLEIKPGRVQYFTVSGLGRFQVEDGRFVPDAKTQAKIEKQRVQQEARAVVISERAANPNEVIGKAFQSTGNICMGIGIPSLVAGTILVAVGNTSTKATGNATTIQSKAKCAAAGYVLMPLGAALTIVGIPLHVHGKRIGELNVNYTGNGASLSMSF